MKKLSSLLKLVPFLSMVLFWSTYVNSQGSGNYFSLENAYNSGEYEECIDLLDKHEAELITAKDSIAANTFFYVGDSYLALGDFEKALGYFENELELRNILENKEELSGTLYNLTYLYNELGYYNKAKEVSTRLIKLDKEYYGKESEEYLSSLLFYIQTLSTYQGKFNEAIKVGNIALKQLSNDNPYYGILLNQIADAHTGLGHYSKAEKMIAEGLNYIAISDGHNSINYAAALSNLGSLFMEKGMFPEAEETLKMANDIFNNLNDYEAEEQYFSTLNNLALVYASLSNFSAAKESFNLIREYDSISFGVQHPYFATTLNNIGTSLNDQKEYQKAIKLFDQSAKIIEKEYGIESADFATYLNNKGNALRELGELEESIKSFENALSIYKELYGKKSLNYTTALFNLGKAQYKKGDKKAALSFREALDVREKILGKNHPLYGKVLPQLAAYNWNIGNNEASLDFFKQTFDNYLNQIDAYFPALSEEEKTKFYYTGLRVDFEKFNSFVVANKSTMPQLSADMYNYQLNTKALIMYATGKVRDNIMNSGDKALIEQYNYWLSLKEELSKLYSATENSEVSKIDSLNNITNELEKELSKRSSQFGKTYGSIRHTWQEIRDKLKEGEAAVEVLRFREFNPNKGGFLTGEIKYAVLIVKPTTVDYPEMVVLENGKIIELRYIINYRNSIRYHIFDTHSYGQLWRPIATKLKDVKKIYFSPDGVYNQLSVNSIYNPDTKQYLLEEMNIHNVTNTKDILYFDKSKDKPKGESMLFGFPDYNFEDNKTPQKEDENRSLRSLSGGGESVGLSRGLRTGLLRYLRGDEGISMLPGTKTEVENIAQMFNNEDLKFKTFYNKEAEEDVLKKMESPELLHIATHGFFLTNVEESSTTNQNKYIENPLLRSGLVLAGAGSFLRTGSAYNDQDGILTAYEAMNMHLDDTEVVVMSACETGLGTISNGEGVYGLQRAFLIAGAKSIIMSMWSVDDDATQELMTEFYQQWLATGDKQESFRKAQYKVKEKYTEPFYWGAFVIVGE